MPTDVIPQIAARYSVSESAARCVYDALVASGGEACSFSHADFGGRVSWAPDACMVGDAGNDNLRRRVAGMCSELSAIVRGSETDAPAAHRREAASGASASRVDLAAGQSWWPAALGEPANHGDDCGVRYAFFPRASRLLLQIGARIEAYDTGAHQIVGCAKKVDASMSVEFPTAAGESVSLDRLKHVQL